jgi:signal transduction histidine kinase
LSVELHVEGRVRSLPPGVELSGYRIVQEALTNSLRHAGPAKVAVIAAVFAAREKAPKRTARSRAASRSTRA